MSRDFPQHAGAMGFRLVFLLPVSARQNDGALRMQHPPGPIPHSDSPWRRPPAAGKHLGGYSTSTLAKWRLTGFGPAYSKVGRNIVYHVTDLDAWLASQRRLSTSDTGQEG